MGHLILVKLHRFKISNEIKLMKCSINQACYGKMQHSAVAAVRFCNHPMRNESGPVTAAASPKVWWLEEDEAFDDDDDGPTEHVFFSEEPASNPCSTVGATGGYTRLVTSVLVFAAKVVVVTVAGMQRRRLHP